MQSGNSSDFVSYTKGGMPGPIFMMFLNWWESALLYPINRFIKRLSLIFC